MHEILEHFDTLLQGGFALLLPPDGLFWVILQLEPKTKLACLNHAEAFRARAAKL